GAEKRITPTAVETASPGASAPPPPFFSSGTLLRSQSSQAAPSESVTRAPCESSADRTAAGTDPSAGNPTVSTFGPPAAAARRRRAAVSALIGAANASRRSVLEGADECAAPVLAAPGDAEPRTAVPVLDRDRRHRVLGLRQRRVERRLVAADVVLVS